MAVLNYDILLTKKCNAYEKDYTFICSCGAIGSGYIG